MAKVSLMEITRFVEKNIQKFHQKRLDSLKKLQLDDVLKRKNPYLFKAKNITTAEQLIRNVTDAFLSSQEEGLFGNFLEELAIFICGKAHKGRKSSAEGIDLEFIKGKTRYIVAVKSGPNWGNSQQISRMVDNFRKAKRILRGNIARKNIVAVKGCCYGKEPNPDKGDYQKLCGQDFWVLISEDRSLYIELIEPLGHKAKEKNDSFYEAYSVSINRFTQEFIDSFCVQGKIDWKRLVHFNSGSNDE